MLPPPRSADTLSRRGCGAGRRRRSPARTAGAAVPASSPLAQRESLRSARRRASASRSSRQGRCGSGRPRGISPRSSSSRRTASACAPPPRARRPASLSSSMTRPPPAAGGRAAWRAPGTGRRSSRRGSRVARAEQRQLLLEPPAAPRWRGPKVERRQRLAVRRPAPPRAPAPAGRCPPAPPTAGRPGRSGAGSRSRGPAARCAAAPPSGAGRRRRCRPGGWPGRGAPPAARWRSRARRGGPGTPSGSSRSPGLRTSAEAASSAGESVPWASAMAEATTTQRSPPASAESTVSRSRTASGSGASRS